MGSSSLADDYIDYDSGLYLARGHLSPASDFVYNSFQDATFYYINAAPQWQNFNAGNWVEVENGIRSFVEDQGRDLVVYTGTNGVMELDDSDGDKVEIYLYPDDEGDRLPVPKSVGLSSKGLQLFSWSVSPKLSMPGSSGSWWWMKAMRPASASSA